MLTVVFGNQKGGAGKTTCCANLAVIAADAGLRTLVVDIDPQGHLTESYLLTDALVDAAAERPSLGDLLDITSSNRPTFDEVVLKEVAPNLDLLPSSERPLERAESSMDSDALGGLTVVKELLAGVEDRYDLVLIDSPPRLTSLAVGPLVAADAVVIPMEPVTFHYLSTDTYIAKVRQVAASPLNPDLRLLGILYNKVKPDAEETKIVFSMVEANGWPTLSTHIPESRYASKAVMLRQLPAAHTYPFTPFAQAFRSASNEILEKLNAMAEEISA